MSAPRLIWHLIRYKPGIYSLDLVLWVAITVMELAYGAIVKRFFDFISGDAVVSWGIGSLALLVIGTALFHFGLQIAGINADVHQRVGIATLLKRNLLQNILAHPGARALAAPAGEALSTFRDDVQELENAVNWFIDFVGEILFGVIALTVMLRISPRITLLTVLPLAGVLLISQFANKRLKQYRQESRRATEKVTGSLGEILGAVQAIQIAGAEPHILTHFQGLNRRRQTTSVRDSVLRQPC